IPALVGGCIVEPEVSAEIDEGDSLIEHRPRNALAVAVGKRGENKVDAVERSLAVLFERRIRVARREMRVDKAKLLPGLPLSEQFRGRELGMSGKQPQQLAADIARGSEDGRPNHGAAPIHWIVYLCKCVHIHAYD